MPHDTQAVRDYRIALGLTLTQCRTDRGYSFRELTELTNIPEQTIRSYERGGTQPTLDRLLTLARALRTQPFAILMTTSEYVFRANGRSTQPLEVISTDRLRLHAVLLFCGLTPDQIQPFEDR
ncbi:helix-turn-helix transcriptional regulator [Actinokineospora sp. NBRC 105648]|uniref:helix-turn-helix domain-containing protein n=1 Tax=Actinokineospora sp. NBRC 105648 TaxID=3032206 RepID=UPI0024A18E5C|nr:helix-turn-helix transcriptional regulator [Actinokineospora sp. NBRC 105648]GLZ37616.1 hypothetical protein Acsp05_12410 [Actinokineospora sp. NBRC 105648]